MGNNMHSSSKQFSKALLYIFLFVIIYSFFIWILVLPSIYEIFLSLLVALLGVLFTIDLSNVSIVFQKKFKLNFNFIDALLIILTLISSISVIFVNPMQGFFVDWNEITLFNWNRVSAAYMILFAMGYYIFIIFEKKRTISPSVVILSFFLGSFIISLIIFLKIIFLEAFNVSFDTNFMTVLCTFFLLLNSIVVCRRNREPVKRELYTLSLSLNNVILFIVTMLCFTAILIPAFNKYPMHSGDQWGQVGKTVRLLKGDLQRHDFTGHYWYHLFLASYTTLSGLPPANAFLTLLPIASIICIAFYEVGKVFSYSKRTFVGELSALLSLFLGFGWIVFILFGGPREMSTTLLNSVARKTHDIHYAGIFGALPLTLSHDVLFGTSAFLTLIFLSFTNSLRKITRIIAIIVVVLFGYLVHAAYIIIFLISYFLYSTFMMIRGRELIRIREVSLSILIGMTGIILIDFISPYPWYTIRGFRIPTFISCLLPIGIFLTTLFHVKLLQLKTVVSKFIKIKNAHLRINMCYILLFIYIIMWIFYVVSFSNYLMSYTRIRWFIYPMLFGVNGVLTILALILFIYRKMDKYNLSFLMVIILACIMINVVRRLSPGFSFGFTENRIIFFFHVSTSILSAMAVEALFESLRNKSVRTILIIKNAKLKHTLSTSSLRVGKTVFFTLILIGGMSSTLLKINGWYLARIKVSRSDIDGALKTAQEIHPNSSVITVSDYFSTQLLRFVGIQPRIQTFGADQASLFFKPKRIETLYHLFSMSNARFIFLREQDQRIINKRFKDGILSEMLTYFPLRFDANGVIVREIPQVTAPSNSGLVVLPVSEKDVFNKDFRARAYSEIWPISALALGGFRYSVIRDFDQAPSNCSTIFLTADLDETNAKTLLNWVKNGGRLVVLNARGSEGHKGLASILGIGSEGAVKLVDGISWEQQYVSVLPIPIHISNSNHSQTKILANFTYNGTIVAPYVYCLNLEAGELIYVEVGGYFDALSEKREGLDLASLYIQLPHLLSPFSFLDRELSMDDEIQYIDFFEGKMDLSGIIRINAKNILIPKEGVTLTSPPHDLGLHPSDEVKLLSVKSNEMIEYIISTSKVSLIGSKEGYAVLLFEKGAEIRALARDGSEITIDVVIDGLSYQLPLEGNVTFEVAPTSFILLSDLRIHAQADAYFSKLLYYLPEAVAPYLLKRQNSLITGAIEMAISISDNDIFIINNLEIEK